MRSRHDAIPRGLSLRALKDGASRPHTTTLVVKEPRWLEALMIRAIHAGQVREHGGARGLRDEALLESALARPRHRYGYDEGVGLIGLAAAYGFDLARDHPFINGNERVTFQAMYVFLGLNGYRIDAARQAGLQALHFTDVQTVADLVERMLSPRA